MKRLFVLYIFLFLFFTENILVAQKNARLDFSLGFREFHFKTTKSCYTTFKLKAIDFYRWTEILEVFHTDYSVQIGNTRTDSVHVFFLGNQLVRTTVFLEDTLSIRYLEKNFGTPQKIGKSFITESEANQILSKGKPRYIYVTQNQWDANFVRMEQKQMYTMKNGKIERKNCLDFYLIDFQDLMNVMMRD